MRRIAVTGTLAAGKSTVCELLRELAGAFVLDADQLVHQLLSPESPIGQKILEAFGSQVLVNGQFDRREIAKQAFTDRKKLHLLEQILHPTVAEEIEKQFQKAKNTGAFPLFVVEIPLLFESKTTYEFDCVIAVIADQDVCQKRFLERGSQEDFHKRLSRQLPSEEKAARSHYTIINNGSLDDLHKQVATLIPTLSTG